MPMSPPSQSVPLSVGRNGLRLIALKGWLKLWRIWHPLTLNHYFATLWRPKRRSMGGNSFLFLGFMMLHRTEKTHVPDFSERNYVGVCRRTDVASALRSAFRCIFSLKIQVAWRIRRSGWLLLFGSRLNIFARWIYFCLKDGKKGYYGKRERPKEMKLKLRTEKLPLLPCSTVPLFYFCQRRALFEENFELDHVVNGYSRLHVFS